MKATSAFSAARDRITLIKARIIVALVVTSLLIASTTASSDIWLYDSTDSKNALYVIKNQPAER